jgi:hypothetical protein
MGFYRRHLVVKSAEEAKGRSTTLANVQISVMLHDISSIARLPNIMGPGSSLGSGGMIGIALFWVAAGFLSGHPSPEDEAPRLRQVNCLRHLSGRLLG